MIWKKRKQVDGNMVTLNDYLYSGDTVLRILQKYMEDLRKEAKKTHGAL